MEQPFNDSTSLNEEKKSDDCGCSDGSCRPKKKNLLSKVLFVVILVAALAIIGIKLAGRTEDASGKQLKAASGKAAVCDTTKGKTCDTTKGSSCCSKK